MTDVDSIANAAPVLTSQPTPHTAQNGATRSSAMLRREPRLGLLEDLPARHRVLGRDCPQRQSRLVPISTNDTGQRMDVSTTWATPARLNAT